MIASNPNRARTLHHHRDDFTIVKNYLNTFPFGIRSSLGSPITSSGAITTNIISFFRFKCRWPHPLWYGTIYLFSELHHGNCDAPSMKNDNRLGLKAPTNFEPDTNNNNNNNNALQYKGVLVDQLEVVHLVIAITF